jgi:hypothetical protein
MQLVITIVLLRSTGVRTAAAFVAGMTVVRLSQGLVFGLLLAQGRTRGTPSGGPGPVSSGMLVALAMLMYAAAAKAAVTHEDPDAPPPRWLTMAQTMSSAKAFLVGAGVILISAKFWVFTLSAIGAIEDADLRGLAGVVAFLAFAVLTVALHLLAILGVLVLPRRAAVALAAAGDWLKAANRWIVIGLGLVFGTWFLLTGLIGIGVL